MNENRRRIKRGLLIGLAVQLVILAVVGGFVYSKYVKQDKLDGQISITAELGTIQLLEHEAEKADNGQYTLNTSVTPVTTNTYDHVLPGLDIPKDPYIKVEGKTPIPAYIFVEVVEDNNDNFALYEKGASDVEKHKIEKLAYRLTDSWHSLGKIGKNGGTVYVYASGDTAISVKGNIDKLSILEGDKIIVSQKVSIDPPAKLEFYATMAQAVNGKTPAEIYTAQGAA